MILKLWSRDSVKKKSPAGIFAELGDNAKSSAFQLSIMSSTEWSLFMSYKWRVFTIFF